MFRQSADKFATMVASMKQMAAEMQHELEATRDELRRGVLEMPQEAAESTAQMRKVIVDQIEALAELNRIVARHGRGLDVVSTDRSSVQREEEPQLAAVGGRDERRPAPAPRAARHRQRIDPAAAGSRHARLAPHRSPAGQPRRCRPGPRWLAVGSAEPRRQRCRRPGRRRAAARRSRPRRRQSAGIAVARHRPPDGSQSRRRNVGSLSARRKQGIQQAALHPAGQKTFDEVARKYRADRNFKQTVDRYITEFERLLDEVARDERGPQALRSHLTSETGLVYTLLAHAAGRLG